MGHVIGVNTMNEENKTTRKIRRVELLKRVTDSRSNYKIGRNIYKSILILLKG